MCFSFFELFWLFLFIDTYIYIIYEREKGKYVEKGRRIRNSQQILPESVAP